MDAGIICGMEDLDGDAAADLLAAFTWEAPVAHGVKRTYEKGCRCEECRAAWRAYCAEMTALRASRPVPPGVHGTANGYVNWSCRCDLCRAAQRVVARAQYEARLKRQVPDAVHGTSEGYVNWSCRCDECRVAGSRRRRLRREGANS